MVITTKAPGGRRRLVSLCLLLLFHLFSTVSAWTATQYARIRPGPSETLTLLSPAGAVSPTATSTTTRTMSAGIGVSITVTFTYLLLPPDAPASACLFTHLGVCSETAPTTRATGSAAINTLVFAPVVIQNPTSCTRTSFSYTTSVLIPTGTLSAYFGTQVTESAQAMLVTTRVVTVSTNLGGQEVLTTEADVYLSASALGLVPEEVSGYFRRSALLNQCVDPSPFICDPKSTLQRQPWDCGPTGYPPTAAQTASPAPTQQGPKNGAVGKRGGLLFVKYLGPVAIMAWQVI